MSSITKSQPLAETAKANTVLEALLHTAQSFPDRVAFRMLDDSTSLTWKDVRERACSIAGGLERLGVKKGDTIALMISNRPEFHIVDLAAVLLGAVPFSIYQTLAPEQIEYLLNDATPKVAVIEERHVERFLAACRSGKKKPEHVIVIEGGNDVAGTIGLDEIIESSTTLDLDTAADEITPDDLVTLIYTSGTTGAPKGVQLSHRNVLSVTNSINDIIQFPDAARVISWLPSAHIAERVAHHYIPIAQGMTVTCCPDPTQVLTYLPQVKPNWFFGVPRIWEKLKAGLEAMVVSQPEESQEKALGALNAALRKVELEQSGQPIPAELSAQVEKADNELFSGLRTFLGFDQVVAVHVGAAPTPRDVLMFFHALGIELAELWGMSETTAVGAVNFPGKAKIGTVGQAFPGVELKLAPDGELLVRSEAVMVGYRNMPKETADAIDPEGWLHTGDIGTLSGDGYLSIIDRKKELIINAAGKNISPSLIEGMVKSASPLIGQVCVIGDGRPYITALILLDSDFAPAWAEQHGLEGKDFADLAEEEAVLNAIQTAVDAANAKLARVEQVKRFKVLAGEWLPGAEELTPTMKLKRKPIAEKYAQTIEHMYE